MPLTRFASDLRGGKLPAFSLVVPDLCHSMHDCPVATGDRWLKGFLRPLLASPALKDSAVFVTFDEGEDGVSGGRVATLVLGPLVRRAARSGQVVTHYGVLRTIEDGLGLPRLGASAAAADHRDLALAAQPRGVSPGRAGGERAAGWNRPPLASVAR